MNLKIRKSVTFMMKYFMRWTMVYGDGLKDIRWKQRFENFEKSYKLLYKYSKEELTTELEKAGLIQFFESCFELSWKLMKDYLESEGFIVKSPRESIKMAFQMDLIDDARVWLEALSSRNLISHTYDEVVFNQLVIDINEIYSIEFEKLYKKLQEEL